MFLRRFAAADGDGLLPNQVIAILTTEALKHECNRAHGRIAIDLAR